MKKILKYLMIALMIFSLCACNKKPAEEEEPEETGIPFTLSADYGNGVSEDFNVSASKEGNLLETVQGLGIMNLLKIETKDGKIVKINDTEANDKSHWDVYVNDQLYDGKIEELTFKQDDVIRMVYVTSAEQPVAEKPAENETIPESPAQTLVGGWQTYENFKENVSADEKKLFELAAAESKNVTYIPLNVLATQMVSGTNYAFLAQGIDTKPSIDYYIIIVYSDLNGYQEIKAINRIRTTSSSKRKFRLHLIRPLLPTRTSPIRRSNCWQPRSLTVPTTWPYVTVRPRATSRSLTSTLSSGTWILPRRYP